MSLLLGRIVLLLLPTAVLPDSVAAESAAPSVVTPLPADSIADEAFDLEEVVVTGTRTPKLLKDTPVQTLLITEKQIERTDATNVEDLLSQELPGVEFSQAMNQQTHLNFAGFGGQGVLFLVDGERLAGETMDDVDFSRLDMTAVERIEIVKGASSALYGSNAGGGVINIITRRGRKPWQVNLNARVGKHHEQRYGATVTTNSSRFTNTFTANYTYLSNYNVHSAPEPLTRVITTVYGHRTWNFKDRLTWRPLEGLSLTGRLGYFFREVKRVEDTPERYRDYSAGLKGEWRISDDDHLELSYSFDQYDKSDLHRLSGLDIRSYSNVQNAVRGVYSHYLREADVLTAGADLMHDYLMNRNLQGRSRSQTSLDAFLQYDWVPAERWEVVGAVRYDYFSDGHLNRFTPKISARFQPISNLNLRAGYGMGFRAPSLKEKYYDFDMAGIWIVLGNPALKPETAHNFNLSADYTTGNYNLTATAYFNRVQDKISTGLPYYLPGDASQLYLNYINLDRYTVWGGDITAQAAWANGWSAKLSYAYTNEHVARDKEGHTANNQYIPARRHSLTVRAGWTHSFGEAYALAVDLNGRVLSGVVNKEYKNYYDISAGTVDVHYPAYTLWKLSTTHTFGSRLKLTVAADNLLNYRPRYYYLNAPLTDGISLLVGLSLTLD